MLHALGGAAIGVACDLTVLAGIPMLVAAPSGVVLASLVGYLRERYQMWRSRDSSFGKGRALDAAGWTVGAILPGIVGLSLA